MHCMMVSFYAGEHHKKTSRQHELTLLVVLYSLLNQIVPNSIPQIDKRDLNSAKKANITTFVNAARLHLPLQPHEFFDPDNLVSNVIVLKFARVRPS